MTTDCLLLSVESQCFESVSNFLMMIVHIAELIANMFTYKKVSLTIIWVGFQGVRFKMGGSKTTPSKTC